MLRLPAGQQAKYTRRRPGIPQFWRPLEFSNVRANVGEPKIVSSDNTTLLIEQVVSDLERSESISEFALRRLVGNLDRLAQYRLIDRDRGIYVDHATFADSIKGAMRIRFDLGTEHLPAEIGRTAIWEVMLAGLEVELAEAIWQADIRFDEEATDGYDATLALLRELQGPWGIIPKPTGFY